MKDVRTYTVKRVTTGLLSLGVLLAAVLMVSALVGPLWVVKIAQADDGGAGVALRVAEQSLGLPPATGSVVYARLNNTPNTTDAMGDITGVVAGVVSKTDLQTWTFSRSYELGVPSLNIALQEATNAAGSGDWSTFRAAPVPANLKGTRNVQVTHIVDWFQFPAAAAATLLPPP